MRIAVDLQCMQSQMYQRVYIDEMNIRINTVHVGQG